MFVFLMTNINISVFMQAVEQLNIKTKSFKDLLTDEAFTRKDIITLQVRCCFMIFIHLHNERVLLFEEQRHCFLFLGPHKPG